MNFFRRSPKDDESDSDDSSSEEEVSDDEGPVADALVEAASGDALPTTTVEDTQETIKGRHTDQDHSDESDEESYETDSEDEEPKKRGWFGFFRKASDSESEDESEEELDDEEQPDLEQQPESANTERPDQKHVVVDVEEEEIAAAIQRVQQRIADYRKKQGATNSSAVTDVQSAESTETETEKVDAEVQNISASTVRDESLETEPFTQQSEEEPLTESSADTVETEESIREVNVQTEQPANDGLETDKNKAEMNKEEAQEEEEEDTPSLSERRSLLSLAAEHNRVDVIKELISMTKSEDDRKSLLNGIGGHIVGDTNEPRDFFVPPPLHAAVAHGSVDAASCLLRMGADPSLRPLLYDSNGLKGSNSSKEEDRNYKKYHDRTAWELAFGALVKIEDDNNSEDKEVEQTSRGWFGFGGTKEETEKALSSSQGGVRYRQISGLNIAANKLDGIRHAFTAETLRAIGSDEVHRLSQMLEAGMTPEIEVAGKTIQKWAGEMDARGCLALMMKYGFNETETDNEQDVSDKKERSADDNEKAESTSNHVEQLAGLSNHDMATLIQENESLIPALTSCRDELAEETDMCQNILKDLQATGGQGGLSSHSLLELVRSLKENRQDMEVLLSEWQEAWEEREDELDWFWEEAIDDELREEFTQNGALDRVVEPLRVGVRPISTGATMNDLTHRYHEAMDRVSTLRSSIARLAVESGRYREEIEKNGLSGALSLVQNLRNEVKELKDKISQAQTGEYRCRKQIELIQSRIGHPVNEDEGDLDDYQLNTIAASHNDENRRHSPINDVGLTQSESMSGRVPTPEIFSSESMKLNGVDAYSEVLCKDETSNHGDSQAEDIASCSEEEADDESSYEGDYEVVETAVDEIMHNDMSSVHDEDRLQDVGDHDIADLQSEPSSENERQDYSAITESTKPVPIKQSELRELGMSTALVVRQPNGTDSSLPSQIWDLLRRIIGLRRSASSINYQEYEANNSRHIMIV